MLLVTGGAGFIGSALVKVLADQGHAVRVLDDASRGRWSRLTGLEDRIERIQGSVTCVDTLARAAEGVDVVYHYAAINGTELFYSCPERVLQVNTAGVMNMLDACVKAKVARVVFASSSEVYGAPSLIPTPERSPLIVPDVENPRFSYSGSKIIGELLTLNYARAHGFAASIVRYHNVYGPDMGTEHVIPQFIARLLDGAAEAELGARVPLIMQGTGQETRSFCYVDDAIRGTLLVAREGAPNSIYNVGNEDEVEIRQLARVVAAALGVDVELRTSELLAGSVGRRCPDTDRLRRLGYRQSVSLEQGVERCCSWYRAHR